MALPADPAAALCIVIHIGAKGNNMLAEVLNARAAITVRTARDGERLQPGFVYVAPADRHVLVLGDVIRLVCGPRENMARPATEIARQP